MANWWEFPVSQGYGQNGEVGVDLATPFHTPISSLFDGIVLGTSGFKPWGGEVDVYVPGNGAFSGEEKILHLDTINVRAGQRVSIGQVVGLSGGQTSGGVHPVTGVDAAGRPYSTGPHIEVDLLDAYLNKIDPTAIVKAGPNLAGLAAGLTGPFSVAQAAPDVAGAIAGLPASIGHGLADALSAGVTDVGAFAKNQLVALVVALVVLYVLFVR